MRLRRYALPSDGQAAPAGGITLRVGAEALVNPNRMSGPLVRQGLTAMHTDILAPPFGCTAALKSATLATSARWAGVMVLSLQAGREKKH